METVEFHGRTAGQLYEEGLGKFRVCGKQEETRNGQVLAMPGLSIFTLSNPRARIIDDPIRRANPFFHMMEFVWMIAGRNDVGWIADYNQQMNVYADGDLLRAAYGNRARVAFGFDQFAQVIKELKGNSKTRQAVVQLWDPRIDAIGSYKDKACNTELLFRVKGCVLNCTVINRSNDFVWGALGANICHLTMIHEMVAHFSGLVLGEYTVVSNNLHMYTGMPRYKEHINQLLVQEIYRRCDPQPMFINDDCYARFAAECELFCAGEKTVRLETPWLKYVVLPAASAWKEYKLRKLVGACRIANAIIHDDWRVACQNWIVRKGTSLSATSMEPSP